MPATDPWDEEEEGEGEGEGDDAERNVGDVLRSDVERAQAKVYVDGYRSGKQTGEEREMQRAFDAGFSEGMQLARVCGALYGHVRSLVAAASSSSSAEETIDTCDTKLLASVECVLFEVVPESGRITDADVKQLERLLSPLSVRSPSSDFLGVFLRDVAPLVVTE